MGGSWIESMVHGQNNNQIKLKARRNREKDGRNGEKRATIAKNQPQKHLFSGAKQGLTGRGRYRAVTKLLLHLQGCNGRRLALVPCAKLVHFWGRWFLAQTTSYVENDYLFCEIAGIFAFF